MPDIFDEFLNELQRRQAGQPTGGQGPRRVGPDADGDGRPDPADAADEPGDDQPPRNAGGPSGPRRSGAGGAPPRRPTPPRPIRPSQDGPGLRTWLILAVVMGVGLMLTVGVDLWTNILWFRSVGFSDVLVTRLGAGAGLFVAGLGLALVVLLANLWLTGRLAPEGAGPGAGGAVREFLARISEASTTTGQGPYGAPRPRVVRDVPSSESELPDLGPLAIWVAAGLAVLIALGVGAALSANWETILLWINRVPFSPDPAKPVIDPVFTRDIGWFLFELPFLRMLQGTVNGLVLASLLVAGIGYLIAATRGRDILATPVRVHLGLLAGLFLLSTAFGYQLDKYELTYSSNGVAAGVGFTDANARFFAYDLLTVVSGMAAALLVGAAFTRWLWPFAATLVVWFLASFLVGSAYPAAVQRFTVEPNKFAQEERFIGNNIAMTRLAYGIDTWEERSFNGSAPLTQAAITQDASTFQNARLWDYRPLGQTLGQLQTVRRYYRFPDVDVDRYTINGSQRQVMLSARELDLAGNPNAAGWVNERITYTHGVGLVMVPVNEVTTEGQPQLIIKNLPPVSSGGAPEVKEPRIYFGEAEGGYVVTGARQVEFDYPRGTGDTTGGTDSAVETRWTGTTGIPLDTTLNRLLLAARFGDLNLLISDQVTSASQLLMNRSLGERLQLIAPFLRYDKDPYVVVDARGRLVYVQDAYTTSDRFPHAQPTIAPDGSGLGSQPFNYLRNSVKITMDAYDGTMTFYVADPSDPIIRAYEGVFPALFRPMSDMPTDLAAHLRVPEDLFNVQTAMYGRYHATQPATFFDSSDTWTVPAGTTSAQSLPSEAYYVIMRMPGEATPEFLLLQPMVPTQRPNMIAWIAARNDAPNYGATRVYRFPSDTTVFGPAQIEARIDQDPIISAQVTLWDQSGSSVIRGNLIVVPIGDSLLYLQPVYLQSTSSKFPEFQRIVVASPTTVVWGRTLTEALNLLLASSAGTSPSLSPAPGSSAGPGASPGPVATAAPGAQLPADVAGLIAYANSHFEAAQAALKNGDFARYGQEIALVQQALQRLESLTTPSAAPKASSAATPAPSASRTP